MFGQLFKKAEPGLDPETEYKSIKELVANLPDTPGWEATYEREISKGTLTRLEQEGIKALRKTHGGRKVYYKIAPGPKSYGSASSM